MGAVFKFKEFEVNQLGCAMKINTDAVLLGALVEADDPLKVLDVGSGTGVIALMLAQRFQNAFIDAVDIDETAYVRSTENFRESIFKDRMCAYHGDFEVVNNQYDLIVSNPPFYINALHNPDERKRLARHADQDFFRRLIRFAKNRLTSAGTLQLILPTELGEDVKLYARDEGFSLIREVDISSFTDSDIIRKIVVFAQREELRRDSSSFIIYQEKGVYSDAYRLLLKPFFLAF